MALGLGQSNQGSFPLRDAIPAGTWHLVADGENINVSVNVQIDIVWRAGTTETVIATTTHTFNPNPPGPNQFNAVPFETDLTGIAAPANPGDLLILRFTTVPGGGSGGTYTPNGDGAAVNGRDPNLTLP